MRHMSGFSLIELMIVVTVVAILSAIAMPAYQVYVTRGKITEATANLADMRVKMEQYFQDNRSYLGACVAGTAAPLPPAATLKYFDFACPAGNLTATTYLVTATGRATAGMLGFVYSVNETNVQTTTIVVGSPAALEGWTGNAVCWVTNKGGAC